MVRYTGCMLHNRHISRMDSYIRSHRKKACLSQDDIAFLLDRRSGAGISRHETDRRMPLLDMALAYEIILGKPVSELYRKFFRQLRKDVSMRAFKLLRRAAPPGCLNKVSGTRRLNELRRIAGASDLPRKRNTGDDQ